MLIPGRLHKKFPGLSDLVSLYIEQKIAAFILECLLSRVLRGSHRVGLDECSPSTTWGRSLLSDDFIAPFRVYEMFSSNRGE